LLMLVFPDPYAEVREFLEQERPSQALTALESHPEQKTAVWYALKGHALTRQRKYDEAAGAFQEAISRGLDPDEEPFLIPDAMEGMDRREAGLNKDLFSKQIGEEGIVPLLKATEDIRYWQRWNAVNVLKALDAEDRIDYCQVYILDLLHAGSCPTRRQAAVKLAQIGDERALEPLARTKERPWGEKRSMDDTLDDAIREINQREGN